MDYIYAKLNEKLAQNQSVEYIPTEIEDSETISVIRPDEDNLNKYKLNVNTQNLVRLVQIKSDVDVADDVIQRFRLFAYNVNSGKYDIQLGDEIVIDHRNESSGSVNITHALIAGQKIPASIDSQGQLVLQYIPVNALQDKVFEKDEQTGQVEVRYIESTIDGNDAE